MRPSGIFFAEALFDMLQVKIVTGRKALVLAVMHLQ